MKGTDPKTGKGTDPKTGHGGLGSQKAPLRPLSSWRNTRKGLFETSDGTPALVAALACPAKNALGAHLSQKGCGEYVPPRSRSPRSL